MTLCHPNELEDLGLRKADLWLTYSFEVLAVIQRRSVSHGVC